MGNMSYCRFRNTLQDLFDCYDAMDESLEDDEEEKARNRMIELCGQIAKEYLGFVEDER